MQDPPVTVRPAGSGDAAAIVAADPNAGTDGGRSAFVAERLAANQVLVALEGSEVAGYLVLDHGFFGRGFVALLFVRPQSRRRGVARTLMRHAEAACRTPRIFTSTNLSNEPMRRLLEALGYRRSGMVDDLDPGDPEVFYSRGLGERARTEAGPAGT